MPPPVFEPTSPHLHLLISCLHVTRASQPLKVSPTMLNRIPSKNYYPRSPSLSGISGHVTSFVNCLYVATVSQRLKVCPTTLERLCPSRCDTFVFLLRASLCLPFRKLSFSTGAAVSQPLQVCPTTLERLCPSSATLCEFILLCRRNSIPTSAGMPDHARTSLPSRCDTSVLLLRASLYLPFRQLSLSTGMIRGEPHHDTYEMISTETVSMLWYWLKDHPLSLTHLQVARLTSISKSVHSYCNILITVKLLVSSSEFKYV